MLHLPILRHGEVYRSLDTAPVPDARGGAPLAEISVANVGLIRRDLRRARAARELLSSWTVDDLLGAVRTAADLWMEARLPVGDRFHGPEDYVAACSASTGLPQTLVRANMDKIAWVLREIDTVLRGLTRGMDLSILDHGVGTQDGVPVAWLPTADSLAAVLPSNSPGVHNLWIPAIPLKTPVALKPGSGDPWTPLRLIEAMCRAGVPREAFGFYPTTHEGGDSLVDLHDRAMVFGGDAVARRYAGRGDVEVHGPGWSKVLVAEDVDPHDHLDLLVESVARNGGRSCINASTIVTARDADGLAHALATRLVALDARPLDAPDAGLAAFTDPAVAEGIDAAITRALGVPGAEDVTAALRDGPRLVRDGQLVFLRPTVIRCAPDHPLAQREFPFPFVTVVGLDAREALAWMGPTLVLTLLTDDELLRRHALTARQVDRLHLGAIPTTRIRWDQPHEGNLFEWLYRRRAVAT